MYTAISHQHQSSHKTCNTCSSIVLTNYHLFLTNTTMQVATVGVIQDSHKPVP